MVGSKETAGRHEAYPLVHGTPAEAHMRQEAKLCAGRRKHQTEAEKRRCMDEVLTKF